MAIFTVSSPITHRSLMNKTKHELASEVLRLMRITSELYALENPRPEAEWHEDLGDVLWWKFPISEPPYVGSPLCLGFSVGGGRFVGGWPGYHTHFTPLPSCKAITANQRANEIEAKHD